MADVASSLKTWSTTAASNSPSSGTSIGNGLDDNLREIQAVVRNLAAQVTVASATTCDLGAVEPRELTVSGTTTITGLGTVSAGISKWVYFSGALILTHNATSLILPTGANITTAAGDCAKFVSSGSGNWRCTAFMRASGQALSAAGILVSNITGLNSGTEATNDASDTTLKADSATASGKDGGDLNLYAGDGSTAVGGLGGDVNISPGDGESLSGNGVLRLMSYARKASSTAGVEVAIDDTNGLVFRNAAKVVFANQTTWAEQDGSPSNIPVITSGGGTGPSIRGNNTCFEVTCGTTPGSTAIVVTFSTGFAGGGPMIIATVGTGGTRKFVCYEVTSTTVTLTPDGSLGTGDKITVLAIGAQ